MNASAAIEAVANESDTNDDLPKGWEFPAVRSVLKVNYGKGLKKSDRVAGSVLVYGSNGVVGHHTASLTKGATIIIGRKGTIGAINFSNVGCWPIDTTYYIDKFHGLDPTYIVHALRSLGLEGLDTSTAIPGLNREDFYKRHIPIPPAAEQKRIVEQVEALLARVNTARQRLAKVPPILKRFRQSVLAGACSGQLTADWRKDDISHNGIPESWQRKPLAEVCDGFQYGSSQKSSKEGQIPVLRMGNMQGGSIDWADLVYSSDNEEIEKYQLSPYTVLFNRTNSPELVGKTGIYRGERPAIFAGYLIRIIHGPELNPQYLNYCLNAPEFREYCAFVRTDGVSQSNINAKKLAAYAIPWCGLDEQQEIVRRVEALFALADRIEQRAKMAAEHVEKTTRSILARAFRGKLVETEAELADRQGREYESAAQLLERIQVDRKN